MDRRLFLQSFSALAGCSVLPAQAATLSSPTATPEVHANFTLPSNDPALHIGVVAVGGAGNALLARYRHQLPGQPRAIALNTDAFGLARSGADVTIQVGEGFTQVRAPHTVRFLSQRVRPQLAEALSGLDLVFIIGAMGGAAGSGIAPMVAETSREQGLLTVAGAILPFALEGPRRRQIAEAAFKALARRTDICVALDNQCFADCAGEETLSATLAHAPAAFLPLYQSIWGALGSEPRIALDPADLRHLFSGGAGKVSMGFSSTDDQAFDGLLPRALAHPLFGDTTLAKAKALLLCIQAPPSALKIRQVRKWVCALEAKATEAPVFWNVTVNPENDSKTALTVLARAHR